jgi:hypothetical protein
MGQIVGRNFRPDENSPHRRFKIGILTTWDSNSKRSFAGRDDCYPVALLNHLL